MTFLVLILILILFFSLSPMGQHTLPSHASAEACLTGRTNVQPPGMGLVQCSVTPSGVCSVVVARPAFRQRHV